MIEYFLAIFFTAIIIYPVGFATAVYLNPIMLAKFKRDYLNQDFGIVFVLGKDNHSFQAHVVNLGEADSITIGTETWACNKGYIHNTKFPEKGFNFRDMDPKKQFGIPCVFVDHYNMRPISIGSIPGKQLPIEISTWLRAHARIQALKGLKILDENKTLGQAALVLIVIVGIVSVMAWLAASNAEGNSQLCIDGIGEVKVIMESVCGATIQNGTIVIRGS